MYQRGKFLGHREACSSFRAQKLRARDEGEYGCGAALRRDVWFQRGETLPRVLAAEGVSIIVTTVHVATERGEE